MLTGAEVEKQIEGWKNRNTWWPHKDPDPIWEEIVFPKQKEKFVIFLKIETITNIYLFQISRLFFFVWEGRSVNYSGVISKALVLPQRYFTYPALPCPTPPPWLLPVVMAETIFSLRRCRYWIGM